MNTMFTAPCNSSIRSHYLKALNTHYLSWGRLQSHSDIRHGPALQKSPVEPVPGAEMKERSPDSSDQQ